MGTNALKEWLSRVVAAEAPPKDIIAYNIGIFETDQGYSAYLAGSTGFDEDDDDWACEADFSPAERYLKIPADYADDSSWQSILRQVVTDAEDFLQSEQAVASFFSRSRAVTVGFDGGDLTRIR